ncbi:MAG TPA: phosphatase PAP2 family protein, partial [Candidatus Binatia bacterium]|nr:phosphatase PAP2 family protein [Candidatus Binatia bacterium]
MHWLQSLDATLFHFVNSTLANPFFDWLMPILSGKGVPWLPVAIVGVLWMLIRGSTRLRICALFAVLVVALGDPLIVGTVKHTVQRPRPFVTQPDARHFGKIGDGYIAPMNNGELPANANRASMPSAHSANWFAMAMTLFVFYRRSAWFMFPMAAAVAFSRVYNGVHYPGDVLAGGILGAGYAVAFMIIWQFLWKTAGKKLFPAWYGRLPNLLNPDPKPKSEFENP